MLDSVLGIIEDGGASRTTKTGIFVSIAIVIVAAVFFGVLYMRYQRLVKKRTEDRQSYLVKAGRLDLRRRCFDADGHIRQAIFIPEHQRGGAERQADPAANGDEKKGVKEKLMETVTSGKLVHFLNNLQMKTKKLGKRFAPVQTPEQRLEAERRAQLHDESVNPLFKLRSGYMGGDARQHETDSDASSGSEDEASDGDLSGKSNASSEDDVQSMDEATRFDDESL